MGIYQLCYLKMHSGMLFLAGHTEDKEKETLLKALSDVMDAARKAMAGKSFARSPRSRSCVTVSIFPLTNFSAPSCFTI